MVKKKTVKVKSSVSDRNSPAATRLAKRIVWQEINLYKQQIKEKIYNIIKARFNSLAFLYHAIQSRGSLIVATILQ